MKKVFRKLCATTILAALLVATFSTANASSHVYVAEEESMQPRVITACPLGNGIHQMRRKGNGFVYNLATQSYIINWGKGWQCTNCYDVIVTSDDPAYGTMVGYYCTYPMDEPYNNSVYIDVPNSSSVSYQGTKN